MRAAPSLAETQSAFLGAVRGGPTPPVLAPLLRPDHGLDVYREAYDVRLRTVLATDFPKLAEALGDEPFADAIRGYLADCPSRHPSVRHVGNRLADWLRDHPPPGAPWAAELARLEWARVDAFDAADQDPVDATVLAGLAPDAWAGLALQPVASLAVLSCDWPVLRLWDDPSLRPDGPEPVHLRVWRQGHAVFHCRIEPDEAEALALAGAGAPFATLCETLGDAARAAALLGRWLADGLIAAAA
jgi:hypothetical protein